MTTSARHVSRPVARRFMAIRHLLAPPRSLPGEPASVMRVVDRLGSLQFDPLDIAGRNHDLTLLARIAGYRRGWTDGLLYESRDLYETYNKQFSLVPTAEPAVVPPDVGPPSRRAQRRGVRRPRSARGRAAGAHPHPRPDVVH